MQIKGHLLANFMLKVKTKTLKSKYQNNKTLQLSAIVVPNLGFAKQKQCNKHGQFSKG